MTRDSSENVGRRPPVAAALAGARPLALEGVFQSLAQGLGDAYLGAYALLLGAGGLALGLVATLPTSATAFAQVLARRLTRGGDARQLLRRAWSIQALTYAALGACVVLPYPAGLVALCAGAMACWGSSGVAVPAWTALVSAVVPRLRHGWFFGLRGSAQQLGMLAAILSGGVLLGWMTGRGQEARGFALVFILAGLARAAGTLLLERVPDHDHAVRARRRPRESGRPRLSAKTRRLATQLWMLHFATHVSTPFFVPYMLKDLDLSYALVGVLIAVPATVKVATLRLWGRVADRTGPGPMLRASGWLVALVPALWLVSASPWWILLAQIYSGLTWGAFELAQASAILQATRGKEREVALFNAVDGGIVISGSIVGGLAVNLFAGPSGSGYLAAMGLSSALRLLPAVGLAWRARGIGKPAWSHLRMPLRIWSVRPTRGMTLRAIGVPEPAGMRAPDADGGAGAERR